MYTPHTWVEVSFDNMAYNLNLLKEKLNTNTRIIGVVKADAYGFGAVEVSKFLVSFGIDMLAVSVLTEGIELRRAGIKVPILIFNYVGIENYDMLFEYDLTPTVCSLPFAKELNRVASLSNRVKKIHINIDTGMTRLGVAIEDLSSFLKELKVLGNLEIEGVYTHFSCADMDDDEYTNNQIDKFKQSCEMIQQVGIEGVSLHIANSAAVMKEIGCNYDFVRIGAAMYGFNPKENMLRCKLSKSLRGALSFKTIVGHLKRVKANTGVSYGATYVTNKDTIIATLPVGYADGVRRLLSNKGQVLINGQRANIIGTIAMDQMMVDVTDIKSVKVGDEVVIIGKQGDEEITLGDVAKLSDTISYEIASLISRRVPRYYIKKDKLFVARGHLENL
jgi:alanine racemase